MAAKKTDEPAPGTDIVQRYRFRVRTADGRELVSHIATVTRPAPVTPMVDLPVHQILVAVKGMKQGDFKAYSGFHDVPGKAAHHQFATDDFHFATTSPRDPATGLPTGRRMHAPVVLAKGNGPSTLQFYQALVTNETLPVVIFDCYGTDAKGQLALAHSVKLTNGSVASVDFRMPNIKDPTQRLYADCAQVALTFQTIELTHGAVVAEETWSA
jgi:type VI secretion system secreted protein Hcp